MSGARHAPRRCASWHSPSCGTARVRSSTMIRLHIQDRSKITDQQASKAPVGSIRSRASTLAGRTKPGGERRPSARGKRCWYKLAADRVAGVRLDPPCGRGESYSHLIITLIDPASSAGSGVPRDGEGAVVIAPVTAAERHKRMPARGHAATLVLG